MMVIAFFSIHSAFYSWVMSLSRPRSEGTLLDCGDTCIRMFLTIVCVFFADYQIFSWSLTGRCWSLPHIHSGSTGVYYRFGH